jgi:hypothetical protein
VSKKRIAELEHALRFYADPARYQGPHQLPRRDDPYTPKDAPYMVDIIRDGGELARKALGGSRK